jgi:hypothetical protein
MLSLLKTSSARIRWRFGSLQIGFAQDDAFIPDFRVKLTLESKNANYLECAFRHLMGLLPAASVVRKE